VSVVLPVHDAEATVGEAVGSILGQTLTDLELVVVDDGSTDGTSHALAAIDDPRLVVVRHDANRGLVAALETAIAHARAPVLARMDADDVALPERLAREHELLQARPAAVLVSTGFVAVDPEGRELARHDVPPDHAATWFRLHFANCIAHPTTMFRRSAYDAVGGYDASMVPAEDHDLWLRMAAVGEVASVPEPLLRYRRGPTSLSSRDATRAMDASNAVAAAAGEQLTGHRPPVRVLAGLRTDGPPLDCGDASDVLDAVLPVYVAIRRACRRRGLPTRSLPGQVLALLERGGVRTADGTWCRGARSHLLAHHPAAVGALARDAGANVSARRRRAR
jgi:GT2 family glycosyltransferase